MAERNPIEILAAISDAPQQPDSQFAARLLDDLLIDLLAESPTDVGDAPVGELRAIDVPQTADVPAMDLLTGANERTENMTRNRIVGGALAIAAAVALIVGVVFLVDDNDDDVETAQETGATTSAPPTTPSASVFGTAQALSIADAYFAAYEAGDAASVMALLTEDATFGDNFSNGPVPRSEWELNVVWSLAQGTVLTTPECTAAAEDGITVNCTHGTRDAVGLALDSAQIPTRTTMLVAPEGISDFQEFFGNPDQGDTGFPFTDWMQVNHPEDAETPGCCASDTVEESVARGELRAQYATEWAAYLEANGCEYDDGC
jgi:hypothetical protein